MADRVYTVKFSMSVIACFRQRGLVVPSGGTSMFEDEIYEFYRELLAGLPPGTAVLTRQPSSDAGGEEIELIPANSNSARIYVHPMTDWIYLLVGRNTSMEFFLRWRKEEQALASLKEVSRAVIEGKFSEDIWTVDGKVVKSRGIFEIGGRAQKMGGFLTIFNPLLRKQRQHYDYSPYMQLDPQQGIKTGHDQPLLIAVGTAVAGCPPHGPGRALISASGSYLG